MKIAICDDEILVARQLEKIVRTAWEKGNAGQRSGELTIGLYTSGTALLEEIEKYDTVFLDLRMPEMDGIEVGKRIREKNPACRIIVATGEVNRFKEGYVIGALRFVTKPFEEEEIAEALEEAAQACLGEGVVEAYFANKPYKLLQKEICYILSYDGYVRLYTKDREYRKDVGLEKLREDLEQRLFA